MITTGMKQQYAYSRIDKFDTAEEKHQRAQVRIDKVMSEIDAVTKRPTPFRIRAAKISAKVGLRLKRIKVAARKMRFQFRRVIEKILRPSTLHIGY